MKNPDFSHELALVNQGFLVIAGIDEVGRGAWAGPVVAAAVSFPIDIVTGRSQPDWLSLIRDSKLLKVKQREKLVPTLQDNCTWAIGECDSQEIDTLGIGNATLLAMKRAVTGLANQPEYLLVDGRDRLAGPYKQQAIIDGDALSVTIGAASIIAKVYRDKLMAEYDTQYPGYNFSTHVGYGTKTHITALADLKPCPIHRLSYKPVKVYISDK